MASLLRFPVFVDLVWERHRSPLAAGLTVLRLLGFVYVQIISQYVDAGRYCADFAGKPMSDAQALTLDVLQGASVLTSALAACTANSFLYVPIALVLGILYLGIAGSFEFVHCTSLMNVGTGDANAIATISTATIDLTFTVLTVFGLLIVSYDKLISYEPKISASAAIATGVFGKVAYGMRIAPLRHHIAAALAFAFCLTATIALAIVGQQQADSVIYDYWDPFIRAWNVLVDYWLAAIASDPQPDFPPEWQQLINMIPHFIQRGSEMIDTFGVAITVTILDALYSTVVGASISCVVVVISLSASYYVIGEDHAALDAFFAARVQSTQRAVLNADGETEESTASGISEELLNGDVDVSEAGTQRQCCRRPKLFLDGNGGTPDVSSDAFTYMSAFPYASLYAINIVTVWVLLTCLFTGIIFAFSSTLLGFRTLVAAVTAALTWIFNKFSVAIFGRCVANGNRIRRPRLLLLLDLVHTVTIGAAAGLTAGFVRFLIGVVWLMFKMTLLSRPIIPNTIASYDAGFVAHAGMMKAAFAGKLDPHSHPREV